MKFEVKKLSKNIILKWNKYFKGYNDDFDENFKYNLFYKKDWKALKKKFKTNLKLFEKGVFYKLL